MPRVVVMEGVEGWWGSFDIVHRVIVDFVLRGNGARVVVVFDLVM
jgi:hypothetical protein